MYHPASQQQYLSIQLHNKRSSQAAVSPTRTLRYQGRRIFGLCCQKYLYGSREVKVEEVSRSRKNTLRAYICSNR